MSHLNAATIIWSHQDAGNNKMVPDGIDSTSLSRALMDERAFFQNGIPSFSGHLKHLPRVDVW